MIRPTRPLIATAALALATPPAWAHPGAHTEGWMAGLMHPLSGADHLLVTLGLGLLAGMATRAAAGSTGTSPGLIARIGMAGALGLAAGALWAFSTGIGGQWVEAAALVGLLAITVALLAAERLGPLGLTAFALAVAVPHGMLHATEGTGLAFGLGLAASSVGLYLAGVVFGRQGLAQMRARTWVATLYAAAFGWMAVGLG